MSYIEKEKLIKADIASIENRVRHAFNQGYDLGFKDGKEKAKPLEQKPTTKNDLHCQYTDEEIAKSFIEDVEAVKDQLHCGEQMDFPSTFDEFAKDYGFKDKNEIYTNGSELIPVFRVKQWLEHISTTKNDLGVDAISRVEMLKYQQYLHGKMSNEENHELWKFIKALPSVTPQEPRKGHWINGDDKCPCCGKSKFEGLDADIWADWQPKYCPNCGADMRGEE